MGKGATVRGVGEVVAGGCCVVLSACSGSGGTTSTPHVSPSTTASPSAATGPCATVHTTTPIAQVPAACAELWQPYQVTMVPPPDILQQEHVPPAPHVLNMTNGAVSQADAQHWADADNWDSGWFKWAEQYGQPYLLRRLAGPAVTSAAEMEALSQGATILQPDCNFYPKAVTLYSVGADGKAYFARKGLPVDAAYVLVETPENGPCAATVRYPDGRIVSLPEPPGTAPLFVPGGLRHDPVLGDIWYSDGGGGCDDPEGPPTEWCGR